MAVRAGGAASGRRRIRRSRPDGDKGGFTDEGPGQGSECGINNTGGDPDKDYDGDGFALKDDCNECNTSINKGAYDIPGNGIDEDCSGTADDEEVECDDGLSKSGSDAFDGAKAIGLCKKADPNGRDWGVVEAKWVKPDGTSLGNMVGVGILQKFGVNAPQLGAAMLALSSGKAEEGAPATTDKGYSHGTPAGYPKESPACPGVTTGTARDGVALELKIRVPTNAQSFSYQQNFFTQEYPDFICSRYNDFFVTMMDPIPSGLEDGNIAFDQDTNPISVNNSLLQVCAPGTPRGQDVRLPARHRPALGHGLPGARGDRLAHHQRSGDARLGDHAPFRHLGLGRRPPRLDRPHRRLQVLGRRRRHADQALRGQVTA